MSEFIDSIEVQNVVASTTLDQELDLANVVMDLKDAEYDPEKFPGLIYRTAEPKAANLLFRSGNIVCTGADSTDSMYESITALLDELKELDIPVPEDPPVTVQNIVSSADLGITLNLNAIAIGLGLENVEYEPEQFPGLVYRLDSPDVVTLLFGSGKLVITGATDRGNAYEAVNAVATTLENLGLLN